MFPPAVVRHARLRYAARAAGRHKLQGRVLCKLGDLSAWASATATVRVRPTATGALTVASPATQGAADLVAANSELALNTTVSP